MLRANFWKPPWPQKNRSQHFQLTERTLIQQITTLLPAIRPYFWGVAAAELDHGALAAGRVDFTRVALLFPDGLGLVATYPGNSVLAGRQVPTESLAPGGAMTIFIGQKGIKAAEPNVTQAETPEAMAAAPTRWAVFAEPEDIADLYGDGPMAQVRRITNVLRIVFEPEAPQAGDHTLIPVARIVREGDTLKPDPGFIPPCLTIHAAPALKALLGDVRDRVLGKARQLEGYKNLSGRGVSVGETAVLLMALRTLSRLTARLDHLLQSPCIPPWDAYGILREIVAELSVFSLEVNALGETWEGTKLLPDYTHTDLGTCFAAAHEVVIRLVDAISAGPRWAARFVFKEPYWTVEIPAHVLTQGGDFWLVLTSDTEDLRSMRESALRMIKLSATDRISTILARAIPGIPIAPSDAPPAGLPHRRGALYFRVDTESAQWEQVISSQSLSLYWDEAPANLDAQLAVLGR